MGGLHALKPNIFESTLSNWRSLFEKKASCEQNILVLRCSSCAYLDPWSEQYLNV
jgi:hypothetical protein